MATDITDTDRLMPMPTRPAGSRALSMSGRPLVGLAAASAAGTALVILAYHEAKTSTSGVHFAVFWAGILLTLGGCVWVGVASASPRVLTLVLTWFGIFTFLPKFLMTVTGPAYFDEFGHLRHVTDMVATGHLGASDPILPVVQYYPGLGLATEAVHYATRLNLWHSGQVVILAAHCGALLMIAAICKLLDFSVRGSFFAGIVFAANPSFIYFDSQYAYESLAITLMLGTVYCCIRVRRSTDRRDGITFTALGVVLATCTTFTHHVTAMVTFAICVLVALLVPAYGYDSDLPTRVQSGRSRRAIQSWVIAGWMGLGVGAWVLGAAGNTRQYLLPSLDRGIRQAWQKAFGGGATSAGSAAAGNGQAQNISHTPFAGTSVPLYEKYAALIVPFVVLVILVFSLWTIWRSESRVRELRTSGPFVALSAGYFVSLPIALTSGGNEAAHRSWPFFYAGVAILSAWGFSRPLAVNAAALRKPRLVEKLAGHRRTTAAGLAAVIFVVLLGNNVAGANVIYRFPGPFVFGSDARFDTPELSGLTTWASRNLPAGAGVVTDRFTEQALLVGTRLNLPNTKQAAVYELYRSPEAPNAAVRELLRANNFRYFVLDTRILTAEPAHNFFQSWAGYDESVNPSALSDIVNSSFIRLIYSTQHYKVYQLSP